jgi:hypothetical protein
MEILLPTHPYHRNIKTQSHENTVIIFCIDAFNINGTCLSGNYKR